MLMQFDAKDLGTILGVWAHPDDETYCMAGIMAAAAQRGQTVACITATKGEKGSQDEARWPTATLAQVREAELLAAFDVLGVENHHWLGYPDGGCADIPEERAITAIADLIIRYKPDTVITFPPDGTTGHSDHIAVSEWVRQALESTKSAAKLYYTVDTNEQYDSFLQPLDEQFDIYFNLDKPTLVPESECDILFRLDGDLVDRKLRALQAMPSQTDGMIKQAGVATMKQMFGYEAFVEATRDISWGKPKV